MKLLDFMELVLTSAFKDTVSEEAAARMIRRLLGRNVSIRVIASLHESPRRISLDHAKLGWLEYEETSDGVALVRHDQSYSGPAMSQRAAA
jgi:hypothetical protein